MGCAKCDVVASKEGFEKRVVLKNGVPDVDGGSHFKGEFDAYLVKLGVLHEVCLPYQHNTVGQVERMNRTIEAIFRH